MSENQAEQTFGVAPVSESVAPTADTSNYRPSLAPPTVAAPIPMFAGQMDLGDETEEAGTSLLDQFEADLEADEVEHVTYIVGGKPRYTVEFTTDVDSEKLKRYTKQAKGRKKNDSDADPKIVAGMTLAEHHVAIYRDGKLLENPDGTPVIFASQEFLSSTKQSDVVSGIRRFLGEGNMLSMSNALYEAAGFGGEVLEANPTTR